MCNVGLPAPCTFALNSVLLVYARTMNLYRPICPFFKNPFSACVTPSYRMLSSALILLVRHINIYLVESFNEIII